MALDDFSQFDEDPYRKRVSDQVYGPNTGIVGPQGDNPWSTPAPTPAPTGTYDMDKFVTGWRDSPFAATEQGFRDYAAQSPYGAGISYSGGDKFTSPTGRMHDIIGKFGTAQAQKRTGYTTDARFANVTGAKPKTAKAVSAKGMGTASARPAANSFLNDTRKLIMEQLAGLKGTPSIDDPVLAAQSQAYRRASDRGVADDRAMLAERAAANGTLQGGQSSGGFDTDLIGLRENAREAQAGYDANLVGDEVQSRRATMRGLLNMAMQSGDAEMARDLQLRLADLDAQLRREGMAADRSMFDANLAQNRYMFDDNRGYNMGRDAEDDYRWRVNLGLGV